MSDFVGWALERWPFAVVISIAVGFLYAGMLLGWGPDVIRPASAQSVQQGITAAKNEVLSSNATVQQQLKSVQDKQDAMEKKLAIKEAREMEQQLLWWRGQNCKSKNNAKNYAWKMLSNLRNSYFDLTGKSWEIPQCFEIGE